MKQISRNLKAGTITLQPEHGDDLFTLSQLIEEGDLIEGRTLRKIKIDRGDHERKPAATTCAVQLRIQAKTIDFTGEQLRILGTVQEGKQDIPRGSHHTITLEPHQNITIIKPHWPTFSLTRITEACSSEPPHILIITLDRDEAYLALLSRTGFEITMHLTSEVQKKAVTQAEKDFSNAVAHEIEQSHQRHHHEAIVLASPAFFKDEVFKRLPATLQAKTILATCSAVGSNGMHEILKRPELINALATSRTGKEIALVDTLFLEIGKASGKSAYGIASCTQAAHAKAITHLLVTDGLIATMRSAGTYPQLSNLMHAAETTGAIVTIISSRHDGGKQLDGLGGVGALLRYPLLF